MGRIGIPCNHVWWACGRLHFVPTDVHPVEELVGEACEAVDRHRRDVARLVGLLRSDATPTELKPERVEKLVATVRGLLEAPDLAGADHRNAAWESGAERILELAETARRYAGERAKNDRVLLPEAWEEDVLEARRDLRTYGDKWWRFLSRRYRDAGRKVESLCRDVAPETDRERIRLLDAILEAGRLRRDIDASSELVGDLFPGLVLGDRANGARAVCRGCDLAGAPSPRHRRRALRGRGHPRPAGRHAGPGRHGGRCGRHRAQQGRRWREPWAHSPERWS